MNSFYNIVETNQRGKSRVLKRFDNEADAIKVFRSFMLQLLDNDVSGRYVYHNYDHCDKGYFDIIDADPEFIVSLPGWYKGAGWYTDCDDEVYLDDEECFSLSVGDDYYALEQVNLLKSIEVCSMLRITRRTLFNWIVDGKIEAKKVGNRWMFDPHVIDEILS